jgi:hypothetical protein
MLNNLTTTPIVPADEDPKLYEGITATDSEQAILLEPTGGLKEQENAVHPAKSDLLR